MDSARLAAALSGLVGSDLAGELARRFIQVRQDCAASILEKASSGKFVEVFVQCLQQIATGTYDRRPNVDDYLRRVEQEMRLDEGLRICAARTARSIYTLRNKRNVAHIGEIDPNRYDLAYCHNAAAWIMAELLRSATGVTMAEAGELIELVQAPVGALVEEIGGVRLVLGDVSVRAEILILLHSLHPHPVAQADIVSSLSRRHPGSVRNALRALYNDKLVHSDSNASYRLTQLGSVAAVDEIAALGAA